MTDPLTLASLSNSVLTQGITFVYSQVGELLKRRRDRRQHADPPEPAAEVSAFDGALAMLVADYGVFDQVAEEMAGLYRMLSDYCTGKKPVTVEDAELLRTVDALRGLLEAVYGQRFTFQDENRPPSGPVVAGEIDVDEVRGYAVAVRVGEVSGSARIEAQAKVTQVKKGERLSGLRLNGSADEGNLPVAVAERLNTFVGRAWVFDRVSEWLSGDSSTFLMTGPPGSGKSRIASRLVESTDCAYVHYCRARHPNSNPLRFVEQLSTALAARLDGYREVLEQRAATNVTISSNASADVVEPGGSVIATKIDIHIHDLSAEAGFDEAVRRPMEHLAEGEPLLVIVEGLDESLSFGPRNLVELMSYVVRSPPPRLRFILTGRSGDVRILDLLGQPDLDLLRDVPSGCSDVADYVTDNLHWLPAATRGRLASRIAEASDENFLYAFHVTRDLMRRQDSIDDPSKIQLPQGLRGFYRDYLSRELTRDRLGQEWRHQVRPVLSLLTVARGDGLTVRQIARAVPNLTGQELPAAQVVDALHACGQFLIWSGGDTPARIWHSSFQDFLTQDQDFAVFPEQANQALAESFLGQWAGRWDDCDEIYAFAHLPSHLIDVLRDADHEVLRQALPTMLTDLSFGRNKTAALGVDSFISDLRAAVALTPTLRKRV